METLNKILTQIKGVKSKISLMDIERKKLVGELNQLTEKYNLHAKLENDIKREAHIAQVRQSKKVIINSPSKGDKKYSFSYEGVTLFVYHRNLTEAKVFIIRSILEKKVTTKQIKQYLKYPNDGRFKNIDTVARKVHSLL